MIWVFGILCFVLLALLCVTMFYLIRFARIILVIEDDFSDAVTVFTNTEELLTKILEMKMFFDSKEVQMVVHQVLNDVRENRMEIGNMALRFVERSKQKYVTIIEEEPDLKELQKKVLMEQIRNRVGSTSEEKWQ